MTPRIDYFTAAPKAARALSQFSFAAGGALDKRLRELVNLRISQINGCAFCIDMHWAHLLKLDMDPRHINSVAGWREGRLVQETYARKIYSAVVGGQIRSAIQITTASSLAAMLDLLAEGKLPQRGFLRQEDVRLADFLGNRFGAVYAPEAQTH